jgi:hypothetical protein
VTGAFLAPAGGTQTQATLNIQSSLTFAGNATYTHTFRAKRRRAKTDKVVANGVTINSSAILTLKGQAQGTLKQLMAAYEGKIKLVFRDFPLRNIHPQAQKAADYIQNLQPEVGA